MEQDLIVNILMVAGICCVLAFISELTGHEEGPMIFFNFEYGKHYSGPGFVKR